MSNFEIIHFINNIWPHYASVVIHQTRLRLTGNMKINDIQILPTSKYSRYLKVDWTGVILMDHMKHVMNYLWKDRSLCGQIMTCNTLIWKNSNIYGPYLGFKNTLLVWNKTQQGDQIIINDYICISHYLIQQNRTHHITSWVIIYQAHSNIWTLWYENFSWIIFLKLNKDIYHRFSIMHVY